MIGISFEITEQKCIERALLEAKARLQAAADLLGLACYSWDPQTNALEWDAKLKAIWGWPADADITYDVWRRGIHPDDWEQVEAAVAKTSDPQGDGIYDIEYRVIGIEDGMERWVAMRGQTSFRDGRPIGFLGIALDVTAQKRAERTREVLSNVRQIDARQRAP
jgi:PAS domain S-box-containing protein